MFIHSKLCDDIEGLCCKQSFRGWSSFGQEMCRLYRDQGTTAAIVAVASTSSTPSFLMMHHMRVIVVATAAAGPGYAQVIDATAATLLPIVAANYSRRDFGSCGRRIRKRNAHRATDSGGRILILKFTILNHLAFWVLILLTVCESM